MQLVLKLDLNISNWYQTFNMTGLKFSYPHRPHAAADHGKSIGSHGSPI
jgi:hypothetical protein